MKDVLVDKAEALLRDDPEALREARRGAEVGNSTIGAVLALGGAPRWATERAVREAIERIDRREEKVSG